MNIQDAQQFMVSLIDGLDDSRDFLKSKTYADNFEDRYKAAEPMLMMLEQEFVNAEDKERFLEEVAIEPAATIRAMSDAETNSRKREMLMMHKNLAMVSFVVPIIMHYKSGMSELLADAVLDEWTRQFPKTNLKKSTFEDINGGFRKSFCYITTAVCENLGKPDDCYELTVLRDYRDGYLRSLEGGSEMIEKYYDIAPTLVNRINRADNSSEIYDQIYNEYLVPCISMIEDGRLLECKTKYEDMVNDLQDKYMFS